MGIEQPSAVHILLCVCGWNGIRPHAEEEAMTGNIVHIRGYTRRKVASEKPDPILMELLATDLLMKMAKPLDDPQFDDMSEDQKQRMREAM